MENEVAAIFDDFDGGTSTLVYTDGSKDICGPNGVKHVPVPVSASIEPKSSGRMTVAQSKETL
jgi:hypothetical protein